MKSQVLADFLVECTWAGAPSENLDEPPFTIEEVAEEWILHVDGASNSQGSGAGLLLASPEGATVEYALHFLFPATNNQAEYEALLAEMRLARELKSKNIRAFTDSQLISGQIAGEFEARDTTMSCYLGKVRVEASHFTRFNVSYIPRGKNARADALSRLATLADGALRRTYVEHLKVPSIEAAEVLPVDSRPAWTKAYIQYLTDDILPDDPMEAKLLKRRAPRFLVLDG